VTLKYKPVADVGRTGTRDKLGSCTYVTDLLLSVPCFSVERSLIRIKVHHLKRVNLADTKMTQYVG
jgi:hypothetical protein